MNRVILCLVLAAAAAGCASPIPLVREVTARTYLNNVARADEDIFVPDRASHFHWETRVLPPEQQRQEFYVRWTGRAVNLVTFEYRQPKRPNDLRVKTITPPQGRHSATIVIQGKEFLEGGAVSAWRVRLWTDPQTNAAEMVSALW